MPSGFTTARTMRKKTPVFRTTSSMAFSQLLGLQERIEEIGESGDGEDEAEGGFDIHGDSFRSRRSAARTRATARGGRASGGRREHRALRFSLESRTSSRS